MSAKPMMVLSGRRMPRLSRASIEGSRSSSVGHWRRRRGLARLRSEAEITGDDPGLALGEQHDGGALAIAACGGNKMPAARSRRSGPVVRGSGAARRGPRTFDQGRQRLADDVDFVLAEERATGAGNRGDDPGAVGGNEPFATCFGGDLGEGAHRPFMAAHRLDGAGRQHQRRPALPAYRLQTGGHGQGRAIAPHQPVDRAGIGVFFAREDGGDAGGAEAFDAFVPEQISQRPIGEQHLLVAEHQDAERQPVEHEGLGSEADQRAFRSRPWRGSTSGASAASVLPRRDR